MKLSELLCGAPVDLGDPNIDHNKSVALTLKREEISDNSLLFITSSIGRHDTPFDASELNPPPYAIIADEKKTVLNPVCPIIRASDTRAALAYAYSNINAIDYNNLKIIGVTGTNGKTTVASLIYGILRSAGYKVGFIGTGKISVCDQVLTEDEYSMTTPDPSLLYTSLRKMQDAGCEYAVMEVSSHSLALNKTAPIKFEYAIFNNLSPEHMDFHKDMESYFESKLKLFQSAKRGLFNLDDSYSRRAYESVSCEKSSVGIIHDGDAYITDVSLLGLSGASFYYRQSRLIFGVKSPLLGSFNVYNSLIALRCVIDLGIKPCIAKRGLEEIKSVNGRMEIIRSDITVVIDYAHTPEAFNNCLKTLFKANNKRQKLICVFGCGGDRDKEKRRLMGKSADLYCDAVILTEDNSRTENLHSIISDIAKGICKEYTFIESRADAIRYALRLANVGDTVAILGKGHEKYIINSSGTNPFDEKKIVKEALLQREIGNAN